MDAPPRPAPAYRPLPRPSKVALDDALFPDAPSALAIRLAMGLRRVFQGLADVLCPAEIAVFEHTTSIAHTAILGAVARHDIADLLEERGPLDAPAIAKARGLHADAVHRTLRALSSMGIFHMDRAGRFRNSRLSRALRSGQLSRTREWALYFSSGSNAAAWLDYAHTMETGESSFERIHGRTVWEWFDAHPDERETFAHCMMGLTVMNAPVIAALYPFGDVKRLCDVGGGRGTLLSEILKRHETLSGVLCDGEGVVASAKELLEARGVLGRVELVAGSFFEKVPSGCDAYLLKNVLHDWDDEAAKRILRVVREAAAPGARVIVCETLVDRLSRDPTGTRVDLQMMIACGGRERSEGELRALLEATGFRPARVFPFPTVSLVEGIAE